MITSPQSPRLAGGFYLTSFCIRSTLSPERDPKMKKQEEFITLNVEQSGFVVYGMGPGTKSCVFRGELLEKFLEQVGKQFSSRKDSANQAWSKIDTLNPNNTRNKVQVRKLLEHAHWACAVCVALQPYAIKCIDGPTDPLRHFYLNRLDEIYTKCFAASHCYGTPNQRLVGLHGLLTDFEFNGGINSQKKETGDGFYSSLAWYFKSYFPPEKYIPRSYVAYGEFALALSDLAQHYPFIARPLGKEFLSYLIPNTNFGFSAKVTCQEKLDLKVKLEKLGMELMNLQKAA